jgi:hypothetical protein
MYKGGIYVVEYRNRVRRMCQSFCVICEKIHLRFYLYISLKKGKRKEKEGGERKRKEGKEKRRKEERKKTTKSVLLAAPQA